MGHNKRNGHIPVSQEKWVYEYLARLLSDMYFYSGLIGKKKKKEFEDTKGLIRIRISKNRQHNGQKKNKQKDKLRSTKHTSSSSGNPPYVQSHRIINAF